MTWVSSAFIFDCGWFETETFILYCSESITTLLYVSEIFRHSKYDKYHWFTLYYRNNIHTSLILSTKHDAIDMAGPSSMQDACRINFVRDLAHRSLCGSVVEHQSAESERSVHCISLFQTNDQSGTFKCARSRCKTCPFIHSVEEISGPKRSIKITDHFTCTSANVIYYITCTYCNKLYIGETGRQL